MACGLFQLGSWLTNAGLGETWTVLARPLKTKAVLIRLHEILTTSAHPSTTQYQLSILLRHIHSMYTIFLNHFSSKSSVLVLVSNTKPINLTLIALPPPFMTPTHVLIKVNVPVWVGCGESNKQAHRKVKTGSSMLFSTFPLSMSANTLCRLRTS